MLNDRFFELASNSPKFCDDQTVTTSSKVENFMPPQFLKENKNKKWVEGL